MPLAIVSKLQAVVVPVSGRATKRHGHFVASAGLVCDIYLSGRGIFRQRLIGGQSKSNRGGLAVPAVLNVQNKIPTGGFFKLGGAIALHIP